MKRFSVLAVFLGLMTGAALAAEKGIMRYSADLMAAPFRDAKVVTSLREKQRLVISERRGAWLNVTTDDRKFKGWVRLHQVSVGDGNPGRSWNVRDTGRSGASGLVATTGIRGLQAGQLKNATPNEAELQKLNGYRATDAQAHEHAAQGGLKDATVSELPRPNASPSE
ncbi:MAG: SH3 domain-containing protein [Pseudomonadota bacterium]